MIDIAIFITIYENEKDHARMKSKLGDTDTLHSFSIALGLALSLPCEAVWP